MSRRAAVVALILVAATAALPACGSGISRSYIPFCPGASQNGSVLVLIAQSVPSATYIPCVAALPAGWAFGGEDIRSGRSPSAPDDPGLRRFERPTSLPPHYSGLRYYRFPGGCVTYRFAFAPGSSFALALEATDALSFVSRSEGVAALREQGFRLCGAGVTCPG